MRRGVRWWPFAVLAVPIGWNAWWMRAELGSVSYVNDNAFHQAVLRWMHGRLESGDHSLDGWFPGVNLGYPVTHHYQTAPHRVAAYLAEITGSDRVIAISTVLLLAAWPIALYVALRRWGFGRIGAVAAASLAPFISSMSGPREGGQMLTGYGYEFESYLWRGNGVWTQLIGMWLLPFALALTYRAVHDGRYRIAAPVVLAATVCCHFITGYFALLCLGVWVLIAPLEARRWWRAFEVGGAAVLMSAWVVVPLLSDSAYTAQLASMQNTYWMDSWGLGEAVTRAATGNLFDFGIEVGRFPILTVLAGIGLGVAVVRARRSVPHRAALGLSAVALVLFAGRPTFGPVLNLLPGGRDLLLHRYILAVHMAGIVLIAIAAAEIPALGAAVERLAERIGGGRLRFGSPAGRSAAIGGVIGVAVVVGAMPAVAERTHYLEVDTAWIHAQQAADAQDGPALRRLFASARARPRQDLRRRARRLGGELSGGPVADVHAGNRGRSGHRRVLGSHPHVDGRRRTRARRLQPTTTRSDGRAIRTPRVRLVGAAAGHPFGCSGALRALRTPHFRLRGRRRRSRPGDQRHPIVARACSVGPVRLVGLRRRCAVTPVDRRRAPDADDALDGGRGACGHRGLLACRSRRRAFRGRGQRGADCGGVPQDGLPRANEGDGRRGRGPAVGGRPGLPGDPRRSRLAHGRLPLRAVSRVPAVGCGRRRNVGRAGARSAPTVEVRRVGGRVRRPAESGRWARWTEGDQPRRPPWIAQAARDRSPDTRSPSRCGPDARIRGWGGGLDGTPFEP
ncbi:MAG: hypothetical protein V9E99_08160 [Microthrixaceae bacterium]